MNKDTAKLSQNEYEPLVSIVVPVYNSSKCLEKCISSILSQTYKNIEVIAVNDGSTDNSLDILRSIQRRDHRITVSNQKNSGGVRARKNGIKLAKGEYILLEDSDDWLDENLVKKCVGVIKKDKTVDIVKFGHIFEPSNKRKNLLSEGIITKSVLEGDEISQVLKRLVYNSDCNHVWNEMVRKSLFDFSDDIFNHIVHKGEDAQINLQVWQKAKKAVFLDDCLYHYAKNPDGVTYSFSAQKIVDNIKDSIYLNSIRKELALEKFGYVDNDILVSNTLTTLSNKIILNLALSKNPKDDMLFMQKELGEDLKRTLIGFDTSKLKQNLLQKRITNNIIKGNTVKNTKYRIAAKLLLKATGQI